MTQDHELWAEPNVYLRAVPAPEAKRSGIASFRSRILELGGAAVESLWSQQGEEAVETSAYCALKLRGARRELLIPRSQDRPLFDGILALAQGVTRTDRRLRYIRVYHAYELLAPAKDPDLKAVRHALSHADGTLSNPRTVASLVQLFGSDVIDLGFRPHRRIHDLQLAKMLLEVDSFIVERIEARMDAWIVIRGAHARTSHVGPRYYGYPRANTYRINSPN